jgi:hypothetical protein
MTVHRPTETSPIPSMLKVFIIRTPIGMGTLFMPMMVQARSALHRPRQGGAEV